VVAASERLESAGDEEVAEGVDWFVDTVPLEGGCEWLLCNVAAAD